MCLYCTAGALCSLHTLHSMSKVNPRQLLVRESKAISGPRKKRSIPVVLCLLALFMIIGGAGITPAFSQHVVSGTVIDADDGSELPGVNIIVKGTNIGTATRLNGEFTLEAPSSNDTLLVSFVGYILEEFPIDGQSEITIPLQRSVTSLDEVVVSVPYGTQTVATTTGSVSQISGQTPGAASIDQPDPVSSRDGSRPDWCYR